MSESTLPGFQEFMRPLFEHLAEAGRPVRARDARDTFSGEALTYAESVSGSMILIDGKRLLSLMIEHGVGVSEVRRYSLLRLDETFFEEADA